MPVYSRQGFSCIIVLQICADPRNGNPDRQDRRCEGDNDDFPMH
jgi:hypothetical protein